MNRVLLLHVGLLICAGCATLRLPELRKQTTAAVSSDSAAMQAALEPESQHANPLELPGAEELAPEDLQPVLSGLQQLRANDPELYGLLVEALKDSSPQHWPILVNQFTAIASLPSDKEDSLQSIRSKTKAGPETIPTTNLPELHSGESQLAANVCTAEEPCASCPTAGGDSGTLKRSLAAESTQQVAKTATPEDAQVKPASYDVPSQQPSRASLVQAKPLSVRTWQDHLREAIRCLGSDNGTGGASVTDAVRLRLLQLVMGNRDLALEPISSLPADVQKFWIDELYGIAILLDENTFSDDRHRYAEAKRHLERAISELRANCPLIVRNLAFVIEIRSYGSFTPFEKNEFKPGQRVLLYAEIENLKVEDTAKGFYTAIRSSYEIFNSAGQKVASHEFSTTEEYCRNLRRDFFVGYEFSIPQDLYPGKHTLQLTVVDLNSDRIGQATISFTVVSPNTTSE